MVIYLANCSHFRRTIESEFDLISGKAYKSFGIRKSVQGIEFENWLPLPLSHKHYQRVKDKVEPSLRKIGVAAGLPDTSAVSPSIHSYLPLTSESPEQTY